MPRERLQNAVPDALRHAPEQARRCVCLMEVVAGEKLVRSLSAEEDLHLLTRLAADEIGGNDRRIRNRLIETPDELRQQLSEVGLQDELAIAGAELLRDEARVMHVARARLLQRGIVGTVSDRVTANRFRRHLRGRGEDTARIDAAAEEDPERHVADEMPRDGAAEQRSELLGGVVVADRDLRFGRSPVPFLVD